MKKRKLEKQLIEELEKLPIVSIVCNNIGISRQTFYRWKKFDTRLSKKINRAIEIGTLSICDLSESKRIELIKEKNFPAIKFWLNNRHREYMSSKMRDDKHVW